METVIIQETDQDILELLYAALEMEGFRVYALQDYDTDFLQVIERARPHVVILDFRLSGEDCIALCRAIKVRYPHLPVVAMSCNSNIHEVYSEHGFDDYIPKPFDLPELYAVLHRYIPVDSADKMNCIKKTHL